MTISLSSYLAATLLPLAVAGEANDTLVEVSRVGRATAAAPAASHHCFGGTYIDVALRVLGSATEPIDVTAQLFQISQRLAAPAGAPFEIAAGLRLSEAAFVPLERSIELPAVERPTTFELRFFARGETGTTPRTIGRQSLIVYPPDLLRELRAFSEKAPIVVDDPLGRLISFLRSQHINHIDIGSEGLFGLTPRERSATGKAQGRAEPARLALRVCPAATDLRGRECDRDETESMLLKNGCRIVRFREQAQKFPSIVIERTDRATTIDVEIPLLDELDQSPEAQLLLLDIVRRALQE